MQKIYLKAVNYYDGQKEYKNVNLEVSSTGSKLVKKIPQDGLVVNQKKCNVIPGLIDLQINGGFGYDFLYATESEIQDFANKILTTGTTHFLATIITEDYKIIEKALQTLANFIDKQTEGATCLGIHVEGPFINKLKKGAHNEKFIIKANNNLVKKWQKMARGHIKYLTFAPELANPSFTKCLLKLNILPSAGHCMASANDIIKHQKVGLRLYTHLFNATPPFQHQEHNNGLTEILNNDHIIPTMIMDTIHVSPNLINITYKLKGPKKLILISDAMSALGLKPGKYKIANSDVIKQKNRVTLTDGKTLAGSSLKMIDGFNNLMKITGCSLNDAVNISSQNALRELKLVNTKIKNNNFLCLGSNNKCIMYIIKNGKLKK